jgi:uncharacterized protein YndB with AHSA1/START domain
MRSSVPRGPAGGHMNLRVAIVLVASLFAERAHATEPVVTEAVIDAPVAVVWEAFTTKGGMESWMAASADIQLAVGGRWRTSHQKNADLDGDTAIHQEILSLDPQRMFSFRTTERRLPCGCWVTPTHRTRRRCARSSNSETRRLWTPWRSASPPAAERPDDCQRGKEAR